MVITGIIFINRELIPYNISQLVAVAEEEKPLVAVAEVVQSKLVTLLQPQAIILILLQ
jgi:hypothetical protein